MTPYTALEVDAVAALADSLVEMTPLVAAVGPPMTPAMLASAMVLAAGITLRSLPMSDRVRVTQSLQAGLDAILTQPPSSRVGAES